MTSGEPHPQKNYREITIERNDYLTIRFRGTIEEAGTWYGDASVMREKLRVGCASHSSAGPVPDGRWVRSKTLNCDECESNTCAEVCFTWLEQHDAEVAQAERERVLDALESFIDDIEQSATDPGFLDATNTVREHVTESLRREGVRHE